MFLRLILVFFCLCSFSSTEVQARAKKNYRKVRSVKARKSYGLQFERKWYYSMNPKAQRAYLVGIKNIVRRMSRKNAKLEDRFIEFLLEKAYALNENGLNYGHIYNREIGFTSHIENMDSRYENAKGEVLNLNQCNSGTAPCAMYTCLTNDPSTGQPKFCCQTGDSTPACVKDGEKTENQKLLFDTLAKCKNDSGSFCETVTRLMTEQTGPVDKWCKETNSTGQDYCKSATKAVLASNGVLAPSVADIPVGENCEKVADEAKKRHHNAKPSYPKKKVFGNNDFWDNISMVARRVCGSDATSKTASIIGTCDVKDLKAPGVGVETSQFTVTKKNQGGRSSGAPPFNLCVEALVEKRFDQVHADQIEKLRNSGLSTNELYVQESALKDLQKRERGKYENELKSKETCRYNKPRRIPVVGAALDISQLPEDIMKKVRDGSDLKAREENGERNLFMAVTGMDPTLFRNTFCKDDFASFEKVFKTAAKTTPYLTINTDKKSDVELRDAAQSAQQAMQVCSQNIKGPEEAGCNWYSDVAVTDITKASSSLPLIAKNMTSGKCMLVEKQEIQRVDQRKIDPITGKRGQDLQSVITVDDLNPTTTDAPIEMTPHEFNQRFVVQEYRCNHDIKTPGASTPVDHAPYKENEDGTFIGI